MKTKKTRLLIAFVVGAALAGLNFSYHAAANGSTFNWTGGGGDSNMNTAANWDANAVPSTNDKVVFPSGSGTIHDNIPGSIHFQSLAVTGGYTFDGNDLFARSVTVTGTTAPTFDSPVHIVTDVSTTVPYNISAPTNGGINFVAPVSFDSSTRYDIVGSLDFNDGVSGSATELHFNNSGQGGGNGTIGLHGDSSGSSANIMVDGGTLKGYGTSAFGSGSETITDNSGGALDFVLSGTSGTYAEPVDLEGGALATESASSGHPNNAHGNVTLGGSTTVNGATAFSGQRTDLEVSGPLAGSGSITPVGGTDGNLIVNSASNTSSIANGTLVPATITTTYSDSNANAVEVDENNIVIVDGARGSTNVNFGGTLKGTGTVGALHVFANGTVAPGHSPGCLNTGNVTLAGTYQVEVGGTTACSGYDQLNVTGAVDVTGGTLTASLYNGFVPSVGQSYTVIKNDGSDAVTGNFTGLAEGASFTNQGVTYRVTYKGGDGNDVVLTVTNVDKSKLPGAPNTGMKLLSANLLAPSVLSLAAAAALLYVRRRLYARR